MAALAKDPDCQAPFSSGHPWMEHEGRHGVPQGPHHLTIGGSAVSGMTLWGRATGQGSCRTVLALPVTFPLSPRCLFPD